MQMPGMKVDVEGLLEPGQLREKSGMATRWLGRVGFDSGDMLGGAEPGKVRVCMPDNEGDQAETTAGESNGGRARA